MTDICLILEGTYPYRTGGVATWTDRLLRGLPDYSFSVAHLYYGPKPESAKFSAPSNLNEVAEISLNNSRTSVTMQSLVESLPEARLYHALSTGIAGMLGTEVKLRKGLPFVLTEHGIYWHEVELGVDELECGFKIVETEEGALLLGRTWEDWNHTFRDLARRAYASADRITTVCAFNQSLQFSLGAPASRSCVIPNGTPAPRNGVHGSGKRETKVKPHIALVARVTPIKDVKTFLRACSIVQDQIPNAEFFVIGPTDHDQPYARECIHLAEELQLRSMTFTGEADVEEFYPTTDIVVLTSISEAQPLVILEAFAHGIPVVTTDVGGLPELVSANGSQRTPAGIICPTANPKRIADGIIQLCRDDALYRECAEAGLDRVKNLYSTQRLVRSYGAIYQEFLHNRN